MSSIIESYEDTLLNECFIPVSLFSVFVFASYWLYKNNQLILSYIIGGITAYLLLIFMLCVFNNVRNTKNYTMPVLSQYLSFALKAILSFIPYSALLVFFALRLVAIDVSDVSEAQSVYVFAVWTVISSFILLSGTQFAKTGSMMQIFNFKIIFQYCIDILIRVVYMLTLFIVLDVLVVGTLAYIIWVFFSLNSPLFWAVCAFALVANLVAMSHFLAQIEYEVVPNEEDEHII